METNKSVFPRQGKINENSYQIRVLPFLKELTQEEREVAITRGVKLYKEEEVKGFKKTFVKEIEFSFKKKLIAIWNLLFNNLITDDLTNHVLREQVNSVKEDIKEKLWFEGSFDPTKVKEIRTDIKVAEVAEKITEIRENKKRKNYIRKQKQKAKKTNE